MARAIEPGTISRVTFIHEYLGKRYEECPMCKKRTLSKRFLWIGMMTRHKLNICETCAYREEFGSKNKHKMKKEKALENTN